MSKIRCFASSKIQITSWRLVKSIFVLKIFEMYKIATQQFLKVSGLGTKHLKRIGFLSKTFEKYLILIQIVQNVSYLYQNVRKVSIFCTKNSICILFWPKTFDWISEKIIRKLQYLYVNIRKISYPYSKLSKISNFYTKCLKSIWCCSKTFRKYWIFIQKHLKSIWISPVF